VGQAASEASTLLAAEGGVETPPDLAGSPLVATLHESHGLMLCDVAHVTRAGGPCSLGGAGDPCSLGQCRMGRSHSAIRTDLAATGMSEADGEEAMRALGLLAAPAAKNTDAGGGGLTRQGSALATAEFITWMDLLHLGEYAPAMQAIGTAPFAHMCVCG
jgi:hypothetical protein